MADAIISAVLERTTATVEEKICGEVSLLRGVKKEILELADKLETIRNVLEDAERRGVKEKSVRGWLKKLEDKAYEMDDILDEWNYYGVDRASAMEKVCCSFIPSSCLCFKKVVVRHDIAMKIQDVNASLDKIFKEKDDFHFVISSLLTTDSAPRVQATSSIDVEKVQGQDVERNKNDIVGKLMIDGDNQQIVSIVGMGGIGKTTLAQLVYNDSRVKDCFELTIWICVSHPFEVAEVARRIIEIVEKESPPNTNQLEVILQKLRDSVSGKKFLLVLDDVWNEDRNKWEPLRINLKHGAASSKILVTTRNERVAKMMGTFDDDIYRPRQLMEEESWSLLLHISRPGRSKEEFREFEEVGKKIASKCKGLPLAVIVLGSVLQFKNSLEEWDNVLKSEIWELDEAEIDLFPHLLLSYNDLSPPLKRCFSYCAVFPKDSEIEVRSLVGKWMALGYLGSVIGNRRAELQGTEYFNNLAMRSLFQDFKRTDSGKEIQWCKMHDIVHDFAQFIRKNGKEETPRMPKRTGQVCDPFLVSHAQEYHSLLWDKEYPPRLYDYPTSLRVLRLAYKFSFVRDIPVFPEGITKLIHLRWLDITRIVFSRNDLKSICKLYFLQTLFLKDCSIKEIPREIKNLVHLRHLDLSWNRELNELPKRMFSLTELQTLLLELCSLKEIPDEIENLVHLRHLDLSANAELQELPESMCSLIELQTLKVARCRNLRGLPKGLDRLSGLSSLTGFLGGNGCNKFGLLKNLNNLSELSILVSSSGPDFDKKELVEDAREAELRKKTHLQKLVIKRDEKERSLSSSLWVNLIEALEPNQNLQLLQIWNYKGARLPHWISSPLNLVRDIYLSGCSELLSLPPMGKLPFLEKLYLEGIKNLKVLAVEWLGIRSGREGEVVIDIPSSSSASLSLVAFPKLKVLTFRDCYYWSEWEDITAEEEESAAISVMPCLKLLCIKYCFKLRMLPPRLLRKASSLQLLDIDNSPKIIQSHWRSISQKNPRLQLRMG